MVNVNRSTKISPRLRTKLRIRKTISGTETKPRLSVFKSVHHIYAQLISDSDGKTLVSASSLDKEVKSLIESKKISAKSVKAATIVGEVLAKRASQKNVAKAVFDRNGFRYTGRIKAISDGARSAGLLF